MLLPLCILSLVVWVVADKSQYCGNIVPELLRLERTVTKFSTKLQDVESRLLVKDAMILNFTKLFANIQTDVAYEVTLPSDIINVHHNAPFKFTNVLYNRGAGYRKGTGIFTAPVSGTYMFWANIMVSDDSHLNIYLYNGNKLIGQGGYSGGTRYGTSSLSTTSFLNKGDQVWLTKHSGSSQLRGDNFSSYGGVLVRAH